MIQTNLNSFTQIYPGLFVFHGAVNTGILTNGDHAILIDCDDKLTPARLAELGIYSVERIYCTQHRRPNTAGICAFQAEVYASGGERGQFEQAAAYWQDWHNRWHLYHCRPGPLAPLFDISIRATVAGGERFTWGDFSLGVFDTPGMTDGAVSYLVESRLSSPGSQRVIFSGDVIYAAGQVWDVHSLQKNMGTFSDYHGFLGATKALIASLKHLPGADCLVPSHGKVITAPSAALQLTIARLEQLYRNYAAVSSLNFYFPHLFHDLRDDPMRMAPAPLIDFPDFIRPVAATSFAIRSESGALFLIDCGSDSVLETLAEWKEQRQYTQLEGCWVTHYHDDHVDALHRLAASFPIPIYVDEHFAEILVHPIRFFLPCISPAAAPVMHVTVHGETWHWHEFELTALHLPGQSYYHGGLLLRGHGLSVLFGGDSFSPTGIDDYTAGNRNFLGANRGYRRCIDLLRQYRPDMILNQHQLQAFAFSDAQLEFIEQNLITRESLLAELLPWDHPNFGTDEGWIRAYPYEIETCAGGTCRVEVRATNHAPHPAALIIEAVPPPGWPVPDQPAPSQVREINGEHIVRAQVAVTVPAETAAGCYPLAFRVTWDGHYLGQVCHALIRVW
jgi:glyoxylase-like metal-dependent hydrolase (beta-lactamase superfamily II)